LEALFPAVDCGFVFKNGVFHLELWQQLQQEARWLEPVTARMTKEIDWVTPLL
jgi:hypothetical protein